MFSTLLYKASKNYLEIELSTLGVAVKDGKVVYILLNLYFTGKSSKRKPEAKCRLRRWLLDCQDEALKQKKTQVKWRNSRRSSKDQSEVQSVRYSVISVSYSVIFSQLSQGIT
jgi:hypothetical protein